MPNWCENELTITGNVLSILDIKFKFVNDPEKRLLEILHPMPQQLKESNTEVYRNDPEHMENMAHQRFINRVKTGYESWYDWAFAEWGTKWSDQGTYMTEEGDNTLHFNFETAWGPPIDGIINISKKYPMLTFAMSFLEGGMGIIGAVGVRNGKIVHESNGKWPDNDVIPYDDENDELYYDLLNEYVSEVRETCMKEVEEKCKASN